MKLLLKNPVMLLNTCDLVFSADEETCFLVFAPPQQATPICIWGYIVIRVTLEIPFWNLLLWKEIPLLHIKNTETYLQIPELW